MKQPETYLHYANFNHRMQVFRGAKEHAKHALTDAFFIIFHNFSLERMTDKFKVQMPKTLAPSLDASY